MRAGHISTADTPVCAAVERVSVVIPVKNEEATIEPLLRALVEQSYRPDEIVVTDGGSKDRTREIVRRFAQTSPVPLVLVETDHAFPGRGRNLAIGRAAHDWIASIDGGTLPDRDWLRALVQAVAREPQARIVYGRYRPRIDTFFTECAAIAYLPPLETFSRSIGSTLIHRSAWEAASGFREDLRSAEDLLFFRSVQAARIPEARADEAFVLWSLQPTAGSTFRRLATYSRYNLKAGLFADWQLRVSSLYLVLATLLLAGVFLWRPLAALPPLILLARSARRIDRWFRARRVERRLRELANPARLLTVTGLSLLIDAATFCGMWSWLGRDVLSRGGRR